jgi:serine/threonine protein kinase
LTPERWAQIEELFHRAAECDPKERIRLLDEACNNDLDLRQEVEVLLSCDGRAGKYVQAAVRSELSAVGFPLTGQSISHYHILDGVGGGGMGLVYRAEDIKLGRLVALKFLPEESAKDPAALGRFEREARAASALEHPNICPIYEFGEHEGQPFLVMQLLEGQTLGAMISAVGLGKPPLNLTKLVDLAIQITDALDAAHRQGIIHRDIKPANVFVTSQGQAKILDFGLAKLARAVTAEGNDSEGDLGDGRDAARLPHDIIPITDSDLFLSRTGVAMGTAGYMSPEQVRGEKLDARTDLFSFGSVLYEMSTGRRAFAGKTGGALREAILSRTPSPARQLNPELPAKLDKIISRALEKDREARYRTASEMGSDLQALKREAESRHLPSRWAMLSGTTLVVLIVGAALWFVKHQALSRTLPDLKLQQLTVNSSENPVTSGAISPDGKYLAYTDARGMHIKHVGTDDVQSVPQPEQLKKDPVNWEILSTSWFPDSQRFVANAHPSSEAQTAWSLQTSSIWIFSIFGRPPRKLRDKALAWSVSPDGSSISFGTNWGKVDTRELWQMGPDGEQARRIYEVSEDSGICCLSFFPDGRRVSYVSTDESGETIVTRDMTGGAVATLVRPSEMKKMGHFSWLSDGRLIYSDPCNGDAFDAPCNYWIERFDTLTGKIIEKPRRLTNWAGFRMSSTSATADNKHIAFLESSGRGMSYLADLEAGGTRLVNSRRFTLEEGGDDLIFDWTADSKTVIIGSNRDDRYAIRKQSLTSDSQETIVSSAEGAIEEAMMSPDGKWVIIAAYHPIPGSLPQQPLLRVPITGGTPELILQRNPTLLGPSFCARPPSTLCAVAEATDDHKQMVVTAFDPVKGRGLELNRFDLDPNLDLNVDNLLCSISPDGTRLAVARGPEGPIQISPLRSGPTQVIPAEGLNKMRFLKWAAGGKGLFVWNVTQDGAEVVHVDLKGNTKVLWTCHSDKCFGVPSPDGHHLAIYEKKVSANMWMMENF